MPALHRATRRAARLFAGLLAMVLLATSQAASAAPGRVAADPSPVTIPEGATASITVTLDQPIIAATPDPEVVLDLTIGDPARVALSTNQLVFAATEWRTPKTLTVTALDNAIHDLTPAVTVTGLVSSASEYYNRYRVTITVNIVDNDPVPTTTTPPTSTTPATSTTTPAVAPAATPPATPPADAPTPTNEDAPDDEAPEPTPTFRAAPAPVPATTPPSSPTSNVTTTTTTPDVPAIGAVPPSPPVDLEVTAARTTTRSDSPVSIWVLVTTATAVAAGGGFTLNRIRRSRPPRTP